MNGNSEAATPFQIIRIFDNRVNNIFDEIIRHAIANTFFDENNIEDNENDEDDLGTKRDKKIIKRMNKKRDKNINNEDDNIINEIEKQFELEEDDNDNKKSKNENNNNNTNSNLTNKDNDNSDIKNKANKESNEAKIKKQNNAKNKKRKNILKINYDKMKKKAKKKKKLSKKELIFSRVCKYIFYSIILFTIYTLIKKLLEYLGVIEGEDANPIENTIPDEETTKLKKQENKLN